MEKINETQRVGLVHRAFAFGLALATTAVIATSTAVVFTGSTHIVGGALARVALAPFQALIGG
jgi:hypothetical protein